jgi:hypothetical protein
MPKYLEAFLRGLTSDQKEELSQFLDIGDPFDIIDDMIIALTDH